MCLATLSYDALERDKNKLALYRQLGATDAELARISRAFKSARQTEIQQAVEQQRKETGT